MAMRCIPEVVKIAKAVRKVCPKAWLINYTNPTNMVCDASIRAGHKRTLGLCDGIWGVKWLCAKLLKIPVGRAHEIDAYPAGVNHHTWAVRLEHKGKDLYKVMDRLIAGADLRPGAGYETIDDNPALNQIEVDACRLYKIFGLLPGTVYYARYYYTLRDLLENHYFTPDHEFRSQWIKRTNAAKYREIEEQMRSGRATIAPHDLEDAAHGDQAIGAIHGIATNSRFLESVIVANKGRAVPNFPEDAVVEVGCRMTGRGPQPVKTPALPLSVEGMVRDAYIFAKLTVDAAMARDRRLVIQAAMAHPAHRDLDTIEKIVDELFEAHKAFLPKYK
jgi:6-phospho-beta-glucosidase